MGVSHFTIDQQQSEFVLDLPLLSVLYSYISKYYVMLSITLYWGRLYEARIAYPVDKSIIQAFNRRTLILSAE